MAIDRAEIAGGILEIDVAGIVTNWRLLKRRAAPAQCAAVVKADAYGLGAGVVAPALAAAGCRRFFVATLDEALALRPMLRQDAEIAVFNGLAPGSAAEFAAQRVVPVLNDPGQIAEWKRTAGRYRRLPAMLHVDTGMARLGLTLPEFERIAADLADCGAIEWRAVISHLACADAPDHPMNEWQLARFAAVRRRLYGIPASLAASSGIFLGPAYHFDLVRPGAALYGVNPQPDQPNPMRQIVRLGARILQIRDVDAGQPVGYGATHVMSAAGRLATVAVGYADGWLRSLSHRGSGRIGGVRVPLLGRVSMDLAVFDVSMIDPAVARPGALIELLGDERGIDGAAAEAGTIGYEILTALGRRYHRIYRGTGEMACEPRRLART
ncbi:MAG TPA: alanine racemase [Stellaceae bacterium]|nr:alanine racemase [Stellaceae bacterium]